LQAQQRTERDARFGLLGQLLTGDRIEHPPRNGNLKSIRQQHDTDFFRISPQ